MQLRYHDYRPQLELPFRIAPSAFVAGRTVAGPGLDLRGFAVLRGDGEWVRVGRNAFFAERATVHIAHDKLCCTIGDDVTVGRFGLVHACTVESGVVVADGATVMDQAVVGAHALIAAGSVVPPRKVLAGGYVYQGHPAAPLREIGRDELAQVAHAIRSGARTTFGTSDDLPPLDAVSFIGEGPPNSALHALGGIGPRVGVAFVAPTATIVGSVEIDDEASVFPGCVLAAGGAHIRVGRRTNVQDNSLLVTDRTRGDLILGRDVTIGHNVRIGAGHFGDRSLIGMASKVADGVVVEEGGCIAAGAHVAPGTIVKAGWIWAGRPARAFRPLKSSEREAFAESVDIYVEYGAAYRAVTA
ncbi:MAG TPA: gamma carbonic anhydrase family protein [Casimicrobiaceae bacterium]|nr:gamma carbonic anhydrase family protein [Casimicrobiaceae bacterium]